MTSRQRSIAAFVTVLGLAAATRDAAGQTAWPDARPVHSPATSPSPSPPFARASIDHRRSALTADTGAVTLRARQPQPSRDSLKNGAVIGAVIGAAGAGVLVGLYCHRYQEDNGPSCRSDVLRGIAAGAALGTGAGLALDAAFDTHEGLAIRMRARF